MAPICIAVLSGRAVREHDDTIYDNWHCNIELGGENIFNQSCHFVVASASASLRPIVHDAIGDNHSWQVQSTQTRDLFRLLIQLLAAQMAGQFRS